jgi:hypothetical protein
MDRLKFYEDEQKVGTYHLVCFSEGILSLIEARIILSPNMWEPQTKRCKLIVSCGCLGYKYNQRKEVVDFANAISSRIGWKHEII